MYEDEDTSIDIYKHSHGWTLDITMYDPYKRIENVPINFCPMCGRDLKGGD